MDSSLLPRLRESALKIVRKASKEGGSIDNGTFTMSVARSEIEKEMKVPKGTLGEGEWKKVVKDTVQECLDNDDDEEAETEIQPKSSSSRTTSKADLKKKRKAKSPIAQNQRKSKSNALPSPSTSPSPSPSVSPITDDKHKEVTRDSDDEESDMSSVYDVPPPAKKRASKKQISKSKASSSDEEKEEVGIDRTVENGAESDMSSVYDVPPSRSRSKSKSKGKGKGKDSDDEVKATRKTSAGTKRKRKDPNEGLSPDEAKVADLKRIVVACGVRKQWGKEFADCPTISSQISHLKNLLSSLGMKGTPTISKAKTLKEKRELAAELDDVRTFERTRGMGNEVERTSRSKARAKDPDDVSDEEEDEDEGLMTRDKDKSQSALGAVLDFLGDDDSDE